MERIKCGECPGAAEIPAVANILPIRYECPVDGEAFEPDMPCKECMGFLHKMVLVYEARLARGERVDNE